MPAEKRRTIPEASKAPRASCPQRTRRVGRTHRKSTDICTDHEAQKRNAIKRTGRCARCPQSGA